jgi:hypothetical protein
MTSHLGPIVFLLATPVTVRSCLGRVIWVSQASESREPGPILWVVSGPEYRDIV